MTTFDNGLADYLDKIGPTPASSMYLSPKTMASNMFSYNSSSTSLEKKLKKTLIEQKILDSDDASSENETKSNIQNDSETESRDEIAEEIKNLHNELKTVSSQCKQTLNDLLSKSKQSLIKQEIKKKIARLDDEVIFNMKIDYKNSFSWFSF